MFKTIRCKKIQFAITPAVSLLYMACTLAAMLLVSCGSNDSKYTMAGNSSKKVFIKKENGGFAMYKNGKPFVIKGGAGISYIAELAACGGNTISCWDTTKLAFVLDEAEKYNVSVMACFDIPGGQYTEFYNDEKKVTDMYNGFKAIVMRYKNHPALLTWTIGNELQMPFTLKASSFYKTFNKLLAMVHSIDPDHPVSTAIINMQKGSLVNIRLRIRDLDFISLNTYNELKALRIKMKRRKWIWNGPYVITEWSPNGGFEAENTTWQAPIENTSTKKAEQFHEFYTKYMPVDDRNFLGSLVYYWGSRQEYTHTWYSVFNEDGSATEIKEVLNDCWKDTVTSHASPKIQFMLIDSLGARDNIIINPGTQHSIALLLQKDQPADSLKYHWEILKEDWIYWGHTWNNFKKAPVVPALLADSSKQNTNFKAPLKEGPYRIFITVFNNKGYCATANTPFYVVE